jgi:GNAT superfamily N-acetyltransferase
MASRLCRRPNAARLCGEPPSSAQTSRGWLASPDESADPPSSSRTIPQGRRTQPAPMPVDSLEYSRSLAKNARDFGCGLPPSTKLRVTPSKRLQPGAQGRIRTSVPRKEEQIYSLPALTTHPPVQKHGIASALPYHCPAIAGIARRRGDAAAGSLPKQKNRRRANLLARAKHHTWKSFLMECRWKICYAAPRKCPAFRNRYWSWRRDLNPRPSDYKSDALPAELRQRSRDDRPCGRNTPPDPFLMSGTINKSTIVGNLRATSPDAPAPTRPATRQEGSLAWLLDAMMAFP